MVKEEKKRCELALKKFEEFNFTYQNRNNDHIDVSLTKSIKSQENCSLYNCSQDTDKYYGAYVSISNQSFKHWSEFFQVDIFKE